MKLARQQSSVRRGLEKTNQSNSEIVKNEQMSKKEVEKCVINYIKSANLLLANKDDWRIKKIVNMQDKMHGNTPLHHAVRSWPRSVVKLLLLLGADLSIKNDDGKSPLRMVEKTVICDLLDEHCMKSEGYDELEMSNGFEGMENADHLHDKDEVPNPDKELYENLFDEYEPRFMTNIGEEPVTFDFELLAPQPSSRRNIRMKTTHREMSVLSEICISKKHRDIVKHPVVKTYIWMKWNRVSRFYHRKLRMDFLLMYLLTWYIFNELGGLEWNNQCMHISEMSATSFSTLNDTCEHNRKTVEKINENRKYGEGENMNIIERSKLYLQDAKKEWNLTCMYVTPSYIGFVIVSIGFLFLIIADWKKLCSRMNYPEDRYYPPKRSFMSIVAPLGMDLVLIGLIIGILIMSYFMVWIGISMLALLTISKELMQFVVSPGSYLIKLSNWSDMIFLTLIVLVVYIPNDLLPDPLSFSLSTNLDMVCPAKMDSGHHDVSIKRDLSAFLIVLSWTRFIFQAARHPGRKTEYLNKYVLMYRTVASSFLKLFCVYCFFILSFSFGFYVMFHNDVGNSKLVLNDGAQPLSSYGFFDTPYFALAKTMAMFMGEIDFDNIPIGVSYARRDGNISVTLSYFFLGAFIFMIVMVLMNLLNGLAVTDITQIIKESEVLHQESMINILEEFEEMAIMNQEGLQRFSRIFPCIPRVLLSAFDISKEILLFTKQYTKDVKSELMPRHITLPNHRFDTQGRNPGKDTRSYWFKCTDERWKLGCEHIISEAVEILLKMKKENVAENEKRKKTINYAS